MFPWRGKRDREERGRGADGRVSWAPAAVCFLLEHIFFSTKMEPAVGWAAGHVASALRVCVAGFVQVDVWREIPRVALPRKVICFFPSFSFGESQTCYRGDISTRVEKKTFLKFLFLTTFFHAILANTWQGAKVHNLFSMRNSWFGHRLGKCIGFLLGYKPAI